MKLYSTPIAICMGSSEKLAFTLAEVLITLGIIGVVAALTIPTLLRNLNDIQYKTAYRKAYAAASLALKKSSADDSLLPFGNVTDYQINFLTFMNQFKVVKKCITNNNSDCWDATGELYGKNFGSGIPDDVSNYHAFMDSSGFAWSMGAPYYFFVDTNGFKKPNQWGKDRFAFFFTNIDKTSTGTPAIVTPFPDHGYNACYQNACGTVGHPDYQKYLGTSWLYN